PNVTTAIAIPIHVVTNKSPKAPNDLDSASIRLIMCPDRALKLYLFPANLSKSLAIPQPPTNTVINSIYILYYNLFIVFYLLLYPFLIYFFYIFLFKKHYAKLILKSSLT